ncbi:hypothetical protein [Streptomyces sp. 4F14]|uniref:hypothetical protein n=1 Tax=Streptomyces sp. 4F14 TaxID=3394380 RepID=UPI003A85C790
MTVTWQRKDDEQWAAVVEFRLALDPQVPDDLPTRILAEAHEAVTESGRTATDLFGEPDAYARSVREERVPDAHRARRDAEGMTPSDRLTAYLAALGALGAVMGVLTWIGEGLWLRPSWSSLAAYVAVVAVVVLVILAAVTRAAGRRAWGFAAGAVVALAGGVTASTLLPEGRSLTLPAPLMVAAGLALTTAAFAFPAPGHWFTPRSGDEHWLTHLEALLRTRHAMPRAQARAHVTEARSHLTPGTSAEETFGPAEIHALHLADGPRRTHRLAHRRRNATTASTVLLIALSTDELLTPDPTSPAFWLYATGLTGLTVHTALLWLRRNPA